MRGTRLLAVDPFLLHKNGVGRRERHVVPVAQVRDGREILVEGSIRNASAGGAMVEVLAN